MAQTKRRTSQITRHAKPVQECPHSCAQKCSPKSRTQNFSKKSSTLFNARPSPRARTNRAISTHSHPRSRAQTMRPNPKDRETNARPTAPPPRALEFANAAASRSAKLPSHSLEAPDNRPSLYRRSHTGGPHAPEARNNRAGQPFPDFPLRWHRSPTAVFPRHLNPQPMTSPIPSKTGAQQSAVRGTNQPHAEASAPRQLRIASSLGCRFRPGHAVAAISLCVLTSRTGIRYCRICPATKLSREASCASFGRCSS